MADRVPPPTNDQLCERYGRRYSVYGLTRNVYGVPIDQPEQTRLDKLDDLVRDCIGGQSCVVPIPGPTRADNGGEVYPAVLDCGCGSGIWIENLLDEKDGYVNVTGVDICHKQSFSDDVEDDEADEDDNGSGDGVQDYEKKRWNLNLAFQTDRSDDRLRPETFDMIHSRFLADGIDAGRWQAYIGDIRRLLKRRGWVQMVELIPHFQSENGRLDDDSYLTTWWTSYSRLLTRMGKNVRVGRDLERMLEREGFEHIQAMPYDVPVGAWNRNQGLGRVNREIAREMLKSLSIWPFMHHGRMPLAQYQSLITGARRELDDDSLKLYYKLYVVRGRRPPSRRR